MSLNERLRNIARGPVWLRIVFTLVFLVDIPLFYALLVKSNPEVLPFLLNAFKFATLLCWVPLDGKPWPKTARAALIVFGMLHFGAFLHRDVLNMFVCVVAITVGIVGGPRNYRAQEGA